MSRDLSREQYASTFGPTTGDRLHLADTGLIAEVEDNAVVYGDETRYGGGRTVRDGLGMKADATSAEGALDWVITNAVIIDPVVGIVKGDIGIKDGRIAGIGSSGNTDTMAGVDKNLVVSANTDVYLGEWLIATPGALDIHVHWNNPELVEHALSTGVTTMLGGGYGGESTTCTPGRRNLEYFIKAADDWPVNVGFYGKGNASRPQVLREQIEWGACGHKIHEDWGATLEVIDTCLTVADEMDVQVCLHADTLNESGFVEDTFDAIDGRTIHMFHAEGAGGGHAPDILELVGQPNMLPSSTNPTMPYAVNSLDELQDMRGRCQRVGSFIFDPPINTMYKFVHDFGGYDKTRPNSRTSTKPESKVPVPRTSGYRHRPVWWMRVPGLSHAGDHPMYPSKDTPGGRRGTNAC